MSIMSYSHEEKAKELQTWYESLYPEEGSQHNDYWLNSGYDEAVKWHGNVTFDAFEALGNPEFAARLNYRNLDIRKFVRGYDKGVQDKEAHDRIEREDEERKQRLEAVKAQFLKDNPHLSERITVTMASATELTITIKVKSHENGEDKS